MRLYRGLKNPYRPERVDPTRRTGGTDFTDCPAIALRYAQGSRGVLLVVDIDPDEHPASMKVTQEYWLVREAKRFMLWGRFDQLISAAFPAKVLRTELRRHGLRDARDDAKAPHLRAFIARELHDRQLRSQLAPRSDIADRVTSYERRWVSSHER